MAPEQSRGDSLTTRADIYGLGATIWHLVTGDPLFIGTSREVIAAHINREVPDLTELAPGMDPGLIALITSMVAKDPAERPASGLDVANRAGEFIGHAGAQPSPEVRRKRTRGLRRGGSRRSGRRRVRRRR